MGLGNGLANFAVNSAPPDPAIAVGPHHIVEIVNSDIAVFDKSGALLYGPVATNTVFSGFGGGCQTNNDGDGVVRYDPIADRFLITQFSVTGANGSSVPFLECVAVSATSDPTGAYRRYSFPYSAFNDYPKFGVWPDGYYVTFNMFNPGGTAFLGAKACAYDRASMLVGAAATQQCFDTSTAYGGLLPADLEGQRPPPAGSPNFLVSLGATNASLASWAFHVDWANPASTSFVGPTALAVDGYTPACGSSGTCIPQTGTSQQLDSLSDRLMFPLQYRNVGDHEALVVSHAITVGASVGVRWYELRPDATRALTVFQQGTYAPDATFRWMSSASMDQAGGIAVGYSASSSSLGPQVRFTGRLAGDALGQMTQGEGVIQGVSGSQTSGLSRWGDYTTMTVDPLDDCTFFYVGEYLQTDGTFNWSTRIASFRLPGCGVATLSSVAVSPSPVSLAKSTSTQLTATGTYSDGSVADVTTTATWSSSDSTIATVSNSAGSQGHVTGVAQGGPVTVTATLGTTSGSTSVTVTAPTLSSVTVSPSPVSLPKGTSTQLTATGTYSDGSVADVTTAATWSSSDSTIATVSNTAGSQGQLGGVAQGGPVTVTATLGTTAGTTSVTVTAPVVTSMRVTPASTTLKLKDTVQLHASLVFSDGTTTDVTASAVWTTSAPSVAVVSTTGLVKGVRTGVATVTAQSQGFSGLCQVKVVRRR